MDILLRRMAKQASSVSETGNGSQEAAAHLDADELNAFAERALPAAAQARYTAHLADCSNCRRLVAQLSGAAGQPLAEFKAETAKASFWQRLPAFLSPAVLRFAAPALVLLAVITVGLITFRQQQSKDLVAQKQDQPTAQPATAEPSAPFVADKIQPTNQSSPAPASTGAPVDKALKAGEKAGTASPVTGADSTETVAVAEEKPKPSKAGEEAQPTFAPEPTTVPPAKAPAPASNVEDKNLAVAKEKQAEKISKDGAAPGVAVAQQARDERAAAGDREGSQSRSRKAAAAGRGGALTANESRRAETEQAKRADQDEVTHEVAGRRFRRQGNAWIDTSYDSARPLITVARGSEQYRALVADEPNIRTIAEKLAGEVIVVWKGRAYRIR
ncbi:MAG TPA: hypothetical protein VJS64_00615 [Pyrinomonadaceae bacterium]|nr:hypothetical protein [Pyrinomonadaceae bacterium]